MIFKKRLKFNFLFLFFVLCFLFSAFCSLVSALSDPGGTITPPRIGFDPNSAGLKERITLDLRNIEIGEALKFLALKGNLNMVIGKNVAGRISLYLTEVTVADVLEIMLL